MSETEAVEILEVYADNHRTMGQHSQADHMAECVAALTAEIARLRGEVWGLQYTLEEVQAGKKAAQEWAAKNPSPSELSAKQD